MLKQNELIIFAVSGFVLWAPALAHAGAMRVGAAERPGVDYQLAQAQSGGQAAQPSGGQPSGKGGGAANGTGRSGAGSSGGVARTPGAERREGGGDRGNAKTMNRQSGNVDAPRGRTGTEQRAAPERRIKDRSDAERSGNVRRTESDGKRARGGDAGRRDHRRGTRFFWGPGAEFFFYDGYYHGDCAWLKRKAAQTGSQYWLRRYRLCRS